PKTEQNLDRAKSEGERSSVEKRFAYNLLEKLIQYLEQASLKMKSVKPSQELTRRNTFRKEGQDVKFFEKVVLPLMHAYFNAHKNYFLEGSTIVQTGTASNREKEMVANLFCRLAALLRIKNRAFGSVAKITVKCLQGLTQALDLRNAAESVHSHSSHREITHRHRTVFAVQIIQNVTCDPVKDYILPIAERLRRMSEKAFKEEEHMRTHPDDADEGTVAEAPSWETDGVYENVAVIFRIWSQSQHFKREELNYMAQFEEDAAMVGGGEMKTGKAAIAERKKKRREGQVKKDKHANSIVIACVKRLLPVGLNVFGGRLEIKFTFIFEPNVDIRL
ncbi:hypothetical protein TELCIR_16851, partial [Teladorsagia circumcincta]